MYCWKIKKCGEKDYEKFINNRKCTVKSFKKYIYDLRPDLNDGKCGIHQDLKYKEKKENAEEE